MASAVAEFAQPLIDRGEVVGLGIGLVVGDRDWCCGLGTTRRAGGRPIAFDSVFEIGSVTKLFTALLMAFLVEDGRLLPSTSLGHCLPGIGTWADPRLPMIPLEQLVSHRSGLPRLPTNIDLSGPNPYADYSSTLLYQYLEIATLATDQGQAYVYSNLGTGLLGHVIEKTASSSLVELWHDRVFAPLSMKDTGIALNASWSSRLVQGYFRDDAGSLTPMIPWAWGELGGAGNLRSTVPDLLQFVRKVIAPGTDPLGLALQRMLRTWFPTGISGLEIGWGWHASATPFGRVIWHNGGTYGFQSFVGIVPERRLAVIILANTFSLSPTIDQLGMSLLRRLSSGPRSPIHQEKR
jgi:CubicO group peptidase (beta-lactamase class C family)